MKNPIVSLKNIAFTYDHKTALENINLTIERGKFIGLVGPNGGGKTTLIKIILGILHPNHGSVHLFDQPLATFNNWHQIGFVSQKSNAFNKGFPATVFEVVSMGLTAKIGYLNFFTSKHREQVNHAIKQVGLEEYAEENIGHLSGGQQQRTFIARALVSKPKLLILDEPTVGVDYKNVEHFYKLLNELNKQQEITFLLVTHNTSALIEYATDMVVLNQTIRFHGSAQEYRSLSEEKLATIYGQPVQL